MDSARDSNHPGAQKQEETMNTPFIVGDEVGWKWGSGLATGVIKEVRREKTTITSAGKNITRNGTNEDPALIINHKNGNQVLKLAHEVQRVRT